MKWLFLISLISFLIGSASAFFLVSLDWVTNWRELNQWILFLFPIVGLSIGLIYYYLGKGIEGGNNVILETIHQPKNRIPFKITPLVLLTTLLTHLVGGSAGREGTAVQMAGGIASPWTGWLGLSGLDRKILITSSLSAGFASVFGTPLSGMVFGLEVLVKGKIRYASIFPALLAALIANYVTMHFWGIDHTSYVIGVIPSLNAFTGFYAIVAGVCFGLTAYIFINSIRIVSEYFKKFVSYPPLRPFFGGILLASLFLLLSYYINNTKFQGLGIPTIAAAFGAPAPFYDFVIKLLLTALTIGCGFKGGEVTPLFFIGAVLGSALTFILPLPVGLLAGMGFVAVFAGATNTPLACIFMAIELFGLESGLFVSIACVVSYLFSGKSSIYNAQRQ